MVCVSIKVICKHLNTCVGNDSKFCDSSNVLEWKILSNDPPDTLNLTFSYLYPGAFQSLEA